METVKDVLGGGRPVPIMAEAMSTPTPAPVATSVAGAGLSPPPAPPAPDATPMPKPAGPDMKPAGTTWQNRRVVLSDYQQGAAASNTNAVTRGVADNELTSKQLSKLLDENGRYIMGARQRAKEGAAGRGMLMSSFAAGAAERAAIEAGAPIAQADAAVFGNTASENMRAQNEDALADQGQGRQLFGQSMALDAQAQEADIGRTFQSEEAGIERGWRSGEAGLDRTQQTALQTMEQNFRGTQAEFDRALSRYLQGDQQAFQGLQAGLDREQQTALAQMQNAFQSREAQTERDWRDTVQGRDQSFTADQNEMSRYQSRFDSYANMMAAREGQLSQQLASIYSNTALTPAQQQAAANNARTVFSSLTASFNAAFAQGIPQIYAAPYTMGSGEPSTTPPPRP